MYVLVPIPFQNEVVPLSTTFMASFNASFGPFTSSVHRIASFNFSLFSYWFLSKRWWDIFLILVWLILQSTLPFTIKHHDVAPPSPNF
jgi:hypothetical protein